jgi:hypothetical protein
MLQTSRLIALKVVVSKVCNLQMFQITKAHLIYPPLQEAAVIASMSKLEHSSLPSSDAAWQQLKHKPYT